MASGRGRVTDDFELIGEELTFVIGLAFPQRQPVERMGLQGVIDGCEELRDIQNRHAGSKFLGPLVVLGEAPLEGK